MNEISKVPVPMLTFDFDDIVSESESIFGDLDKEFDKVLNTETVSIFSFFFFFFTNFIFLKRGYKIRENREVVYATAERKRTAAQRAVSGPIKKYNPVTETPPPPMPSISIEQESQFPTKKNRRKSSILDTDAVAAYLLEYWKLSKVLLPGLETKNAKFTMVLDNGLHSITTPFSSLLDKSLLWSKNLSLLLAQI